MILTPHERMVIVESIKHWQNDIINRFKHGQTIKKKENYTYLMFWSDGSQLEDTSDRCPLCRMFMLSGKTSDHHCARCPYYRRYGYSCDSTQGHWFTWTKKRILQNAEAMRDALKDLLILDREGQ